MTGSSLWASQSRTKQEPMKPAPPVTNKVINPILAEVTEGSCLMVSQGHCTAVTALAIEPAHAAAAA
jgi:hypothetical protein